MNDPQEFINELREAGVKVSVRHLRGIPSFPYGLAPTYQLRAIGVAPAPRGGATIVEAERDGKKFKASAKCSPADNFVKRVGLAKAVGRLRSRMLKEGVIS